MIGRPDLAGCDALYEVPGYSGRDVRLHRIRPAQPVAAALDDCLHRGLHQAGCASELLLDAIKPGLMSQFLGPLSFFIDDLYGFLHSHQGFADLLQRRAPGR